MTGAAWAALSGAAVVAGLFLVASALVPRPVRLDDALHRLASGEAPAMQIEGSYGWEDRLGRAAHHLERPISAKTSALLELKGIQTSRFLADKVVLGVLGLAVPTVIGVAFGLLLGTGLALPLGVSLVAGTVGFFWPDLRLHRSGGLAREDAAEALLTFFDLVTLERLANQSAPQALYAAASVSDVTPFRQVRAVLDAARLEQRAPYPALKALADDLGLPELRDVVDVMSLDEQGASLVGSLRARVKELRDAHLTEQKIKAHEVSERLTVFMVIPALIFGLIFLVPPLLLLIFPQ